MLLRSAPEGQHNGSVRRRPAGSAYTGTAQIRLGFVPYGVNVNVGRLLPNEYMVDSVPFQTREANYDTTNNWGWVAGTEAATNWNGWSAPSNLTTQSTYSSWTDLSNSPTTITINGTSYTKRPTGRNSTTCPQLNTLSGGQMVAYVDVAGTNGTPSNTGTSPTNPVHGTHTQQTVSYSQNNTHGVTGYKYVWNSAAAAAAACKAGLVRTPLPARAAASSP